MGAYISSSFIVSPQAASGSENWLEEAIEYESAIIKCSEPDYKEIINPAQLRRLPRILKTGLYTALKCMDKQANPDAIIIATGSGCLDELEKFMVQVIENKQGVLSPASFILSTSNLVGSQIAMATSNTSYNMNYVNRSFAFENALTDAMMLLEEKRAGNVLIGGIDEITEYHFKIFGYLNYWKEKSFKNTELYKIKSPGTIAGEGCSFFSLTSKESEGSTKLAGVHTIYKPETKEALNNDFAAFLDTLNISVTDIDIVISGNNGDINFDHVYTDFIKDNFKQTQSVVKYKSLCGEYYTSSGFALGIAQHIIKTQKIPASITPENKPEKIETILIYNQFRNKEHSFIVVSKK